MINVKFREKIREFALEYHKNNLPGNGKIEIIPKVKVEDPYDLSLAYTPGVAEPCKAIANGESYENYTIIPNTVAVISDGSAVLGLGDVGILAGMPVLEGKCVLFKALAGVDAFPILIDTKDIDEIVNTVKLISKGFGGINLEDISAPRCFEIEEKLKKELDIPVFHDDQHGTAVVTLAGLINALKIVGKKFADIKVVIKGAGAAGIAIAKILHQRGIREILIVDRKGIIHEGREDLNPYKREVAKFNINGIEGELIDAINGADVFIGVSVGESVSKEVIRRMSDDAIVFALANPIPEIMPEKAKEAGARIIATGRSDYPNQINNVLGFPGIFRGALDVRAREITFDMNIAAAEAIANTISEDELFEDYIIPTPLHPEVYPKTARTVAEQAIKDGVARKKVSGEWVEEHIKKLSLYLVKASLFRVGM
ncbi:NADP-dependent malic enzyme [Thermococcus sp.]|uniref:NAD(P)-dependent malic enzyme n=1 Tax=Thermococcus sp. TaxID=35749 RepID=UPI00076D0888|nr:NADP-dependent malic enzyme [Thermococcus sp.]KUK29007.1 MAG: Malate oxidoreductase [Thermococcus sp. 40_45]MBC7095377.1 NADP-dependent malic enzyme [Thermococcus sp.]HII67270.1 NADP-dependent malic enzyme [Thermococcaceae archaeon]